MIYVVVNFGGDNECGSYWHTNLFGSSSKEKAELFLKNILELKTRIVSANADYWQWVKEEIPWQKYPTFSERDKVINDKLKSLATQYQLESTDFLGDPGFYEIEEVPSDDD